MIDLVENLRLMVWKFIILKENMEEKLYIKFFDKLCILYNILLWYLLLVNFKLDI